jgi:hypothetical protein
MPMLIVTSFKHAVPFIVYHSQDAKWQSQEHQEPNPKLQVRYESLAIIIWSPNHIYLYLDM